MRMRFVRSLAILAALAGIVLLSMPAPARATLTVTMQEDAGVVATVIGPVVGVPAPFPGQSGTFSGVIGAGGIGPPGDFQVVIQGAQSTMDVTGAIAELFSSATSITNLTTVTHTIHIVVTGTGYVSPTAAGSVLLSHIGGTVPTVFGPGNSLTFQSFVTAPLQTTGPQSPALPAVGSYASDASVALATALSSPFTMFTRLDITLVGLSQINYSASTTLTPVVPEPASLAMALSGLPILGLFWARRRRQQA